MRDTRIDTYIQKSQAFAQPILNTLRNCIHEACPGVEETIKWRFPHFEYAGATLCSIAAFKEYCVMTFRNYEAMQDAHHILKPLGSEGMGNIGKIRELSDLPSATILKQYLKEAADLNLKGVKPKKPKVEGDKVLPEPHPDFLQLLTSNQVLKTHFDNMSYSSQKQYLLWVNEAKTDATRQRRIELAHAQILERKPLNWKYQKKPSD
jgi:uncharacterized protein YdeI (YjbR/CyaY-like superfamily)